MDDVHKIDVNRPAVAVEGFGRRLVGLAERFDELAVAPAAIGERIVDCHHKERSAAVHAAPEWQSRPRDGDDLDDMMRNCDLYLQLADKLAPETAKVRCGRILRRLSAGSLARGVVHTAQRARRGWADCDLWSADTHLARVTAGMLRGIADTTYGYPEGYATLDEWAADLRRHADTIEAPLDPDGKIGAALMEWSDAARRHGRDSEQTEAAWERLNRLEQDRKDAADASWAWIAAHRGVLYA